ncbi:MAG: four helix bundle protein [Parcubacteria group bacterium]|nr:four helix bundle protein [Parcubacteria group bacterium]|tara:strand:+ start:10810 stop:11199 length:390 start_codon:yes stop_codon:yes gene_type:complete
MESGKQKIKTFKDLYAWQEGYDLVLIVYYITKKFPREEIFGLTSQMRRCAVSITSNIAEGFGRPSYKEKVKFYSIARASLTELQNQILIANGINYLLIEELQKISLQSIKVHKIINGLIKKSKTHIPDS